MTVSIPASWRLIDGTKPGRGPLTDAEIQKREHDIEVALHYRADRVVARLRLELARDIQRYGRQSRRTGRPTPPFDGDSAA